MRHFGELRFVQMNEIIFVALNLLSSVYIITYWLSVRLPYGDILHSLTYVGIR